MIEVLLHILLVILKVAGIILGSVFALLLILILLVLFVPIRYEVDAAYRGEPEARVKVSWLLRIFRVSVDYKKELVIKAKVLFFTLFSSEKNENSQKIKKNVSSKEEMPFKADRETVSEDEKRVSHAENDMIPAEEKVSETEKLFEVQGISETKKSSEPEILYGIEDISDQSEYETLRLNVNAVSKDSSLTEKNEDVSGEKSSESACFQDKEDESERASFFEKLSDRLSDTVHMLKAWIIRIRDRAVSFAEELKNKTASARDEVSQKIEKVKSIIDDEEYRALAKFLWIQLKKALNIIKPRKFLIEARFGFEDPATTGQVLMILSLLYGFIGEHMDIRPEFEESVMEGRIYLAGRIRLIGFVIIGVRVFFNGLVQKKIIKKIRKS